MLEAITVRLTPKNQAAIETLREQEAIVLDELINQALDDYLFARRFDALRELLSQPDANGKTYTEQEIFEMIS